MRRVLFSMAVLLAVLVVWVAWPRTDATLTGVATPGQPSSSGAQARAAVESGPWDEEERAPPRTGPAPDGEVRVAVPVDAVPVRVRVVDPDGRALSGIPVAFDGGEGRTELTDVEGRVAAMLAPGDHEVLANARADLRSSPDFGPAVREVAVLAGAETSVEVVLSRFDAALSVLVVDDRGMPIEGVDLSVKVDDEQRQRTDAQGRVLFLRLPPHPLTFVGMHNPEEFAKRYAVPGQPRGVRLVARRTTELRIAMPRVASLRITCERPPGGEGVQAFRLYLVPVFDPYPFTVGAVVPRIDRVVELEETTTVSGLPSGRCMVALVSRPDTHVLLIGDAGPLTLAPAETTEARVPLRRYDGEVTGTVVDLLGNPVVGMEVLLECSFEASSALGRPTLGARYPVARITQTAADGSFALRGVPEGPLRLTPQVETARGAGYAPVSVTLPAPRQGVVIMLERGYAVRGRVVDRRTGEAVAGGRAFLDARGVRPRGIELDETGVFAFRGLDAGEYRVWYDSGFGVKQDRKTVTVSSESGDAEVRLVVRTYR